MITEYLDSTSEKIDVQNVQQKDDVHNVEVRSRFAPDG